MRYVVIVLSVLVLVGSVGDAEAKKRKRSTLVVRDYTSEAWSGVIQQTVDDFNAAMPRRGPRLTYQRGEGECPRFAPKRTIVFCSVEVIASPGPGFPDPGGIVYNRRTIHLADTYIRGEGSVHRRNHACHELMHVLTGIPDTERSLDVDSCVWGFTPSPGAFDVAQLRKRY